MSMKSTLSSAAVLLLGALTLTACQPGTATTAGGSTTAQQTSSSSAPASTAAPTSAPSASTSTHGGGSAGSTSGNGTSGTNGSSSGNGSGSSSSGGSSSGSKADSDSYAYTHPCSSQQVSVHVVSRSGAASQRVIEVRNLGADSCGLSYYPLVYLDNSQSADASRAVKPLVPGGLGGAPAYPVYAGQTAYAVIDLDPSGATTGTASGVDELNVLADGDHMPNADTRNFPLGSGALVLKPKLGLYRSTVADAAAVMAEANTPSS